MRLESRIRKLEKMLPDLEKPPEWVIKACGVLKMTRLDVMMKWPTEDIFRKYWEGGNHWIFRDDDFDTVVNPIKDETFHIIGGYIMVGLPKIDAFGVSPEKLEDLEWVTLEPDKPIRIKPYTPHSFYSITGGTMIEVSTPHSDEDVKRHTKSGKLTKEIYESIVR